jgi:dTDP-glucose pyrophosphorylase
VRLGNIPRTRLNAFAIVDADTDGRLRRIVEKPGAGSRIDDDTLISMNLWAFTPHVFDLCERVPRSGRGEYEIASVIQLAIQEGISFRVVPIEDGVLDLTERSDIAVVTERLRDVTVDL